MANNPCPKCGGGVMRLAVLAVILTLSANLNSKPACAVTAAPRVSNAPLRFMRLHVTVEPGLQVGRIEVALVGEEGVVTSSLLWERGWNDAPRTFDLEWRSLNEPAGDYEVIVGAGSCRAVQQIIVG